MSGILDDLDVINCKFMALEKENKRLRKSIEHLTHELHDKDLELQALKGDQKEDESNAGID